MTRLLALALVLWAGAAGAQVQTDAAGLREIAARLLVQGEVKRAGELAQALLARDPDDLDALLLLSRAEIEAGDYRAALPPARRAHGLATGSARFLAARLAARAHAELGEYTRAQLWLRRARGDVPDAEALRTLSEDFRAVRAVNPLSIRLSFGAAPTSNINGGTSAEVVWVYVPFLGGYIPTIPQGDALPLSGLRVSAGATLSYRIHATERSATSVEAQFAGRTYLLSPESRDIAPDAEGSDYADLSFSESLVHRWAGEGASGPSSLRATLGRSWYGGDPYTRFASLSYDRAFALDENDRLDLSVFADWTEKREERRSGVSFDRYSSIGLRTRWTHELESRDEVNLSFALRDHLQEIPDVTSTGVTLGGGYDWARPILGVRLGVGAEVDWRQFDLSFQAPEGREDLRATLRASLGLSRFDIWGFEPTLGVEASRTWSDSDRADKDALTVDLGFRSTF